MKAGQGKKCLLGRKAGVPMANEVRDEEYADSKHESDEAKRMR